MENSNLRSYRHIVSNSVDIANSLILNSSYPTIIIDKNFKVIFINERALRLHGIPLKNIFMKNYLGVLCRNEDEYEEFAESYKNIFEEKKPLYIKNKQDNSYIMIFPILSPETGDVEYVHNIFIIDELHMTASQKDDLSFNHDYVHFAHLLAVLLEAKDKYTANHSSNVTKYSTLLGKFIGITGLELEKLKLAANLHDIGKVGIPNYILNKNGNLNDEEFANIKEHSYYSGIILKVFKNLGHISEAGLYHHEKFNGTGYPDGLKGRDIPLNARIIAIADSFDAMTTDRPYKKAMSLDEAITELKANRATQFDPYLVDKFANLDLQSAMDSLNEFDSEYTDEFTVTKEEHEHMRQNINKMLNNIDAFAIIENMVSYNYYGFIISKVSNEHKNNKDQCYELLYKSSLVDDFTYDGYLQGNWQLCLKEKKRTICNHCPIDRCLQTNSTFFRKTKLTNTDGEVKYLNVLLHHTSDLSTNDKFIVELFKDETTAAIYGNSVATEFFSFVDNLSKIFAEQNKEFSVIYSEMRNLANWIANKVDISNYKIELLNKALSICDIGIIALLDSNEYSFESLEKLRKNEKHIHILYSMITKLRTFGDIKDIVLYHHALYNETEYDLCGDEVPIQSYIIGVTDFLLTYTVMGHPIEETLKHLESVKGTLVSPVICNSILYGDARDELRKMLELVKLK